MADGTKIEWTDATWNPVTGCSVVSPGCTNCYAMRLAGTRMRHHPSRHGLTVPSKAGPVWNGTVRFNSGWLTQPLQWKRPRRIFVCAHGDLFHEAVPDAVIDQVFAVMALCPQHQFQVLTKRPERMRDYMTSPNEHGGRGRELQVYEQWRLMREEWRKALPGCREWDDWSWRDAHGLGSCNPDWPLPNVWLGVSVEDQARTDERVPLLLATPAAVRWLSCEPLLGPINFNALAERDTPENLNALTGLRENPFGAIVGRRFGTKIDWVVVGGESGPGARPMHPGWARYLRDQCAAANVPFLFKQWGAWIGAEVVTEQRDGQLCGGITRHPHGGAGATAGRPTHWWDDTDSFRPGPVSIQVGKGAAGRQLDGVAHDGFPA